MQALLRSEASEITDRRMIIGGRRRRWLGSLARFRKVACLESQRHDMNLVGRDSQVRLHEVRVVTTVHDESIDPLDEPLDLGDGHCLVRLRETFEKNIVSL